MYLAKALQNFFMVIPRSWSSIEKQRDPVQTEHVARPAATDARFKASAFFSFAAWLTIVFSLHHSIKHYNAGIGHDESFRPIHRILSHVPTRCLLTLLLSLIMIAYTAACTFDFSISPLNLHPKLGMMYGLGWGVPFAIIIIFGLWGYIDPNEDRELIKQRRGRDVEANQEFGLVDKSHWWNRWHGQTVANNLPQAIAWNVKQVEEGRSANGAIPNNIEMNNVSASAKSQTLDGVAKASDHRPTGGAGWTARQWVLQHLRMS